MSVLDNQTKLNVAQSIYAAAGSGGGGGGGGGAVVGASSITVSTITFAGPGLGGDPSIFMEGGSILFNTQASAAAIGGAGIAWNPVTSTLAVQAPSTTTLFLGTDKGNGVSITDDPAKGATFNLPIYTTQNINAQQANVSSIGTGGSTMYINPFQTDLVPKKVTTITTSQYLPPNGSATLASFSTIPGGVYEIGIPYFVTSLEPVASPTDGSILELFLNTTPINYLDQWDLARVSSMANEFRCSRSYIFIADQNNHSLGANTVNPTLSTLVELGQNVWIKCLGGSNLLPAAN